MDTVPMLMIAGMPRSGSTWVGNIFDSHPQTIYIHEPDSQIHTQAFTQFPRTAIFNPSRSPVLDNTLTPSLAAAACERLESYPFLISPIYRQCAPTRISVLSMVCAALTLS